MTNRTVCANDKTIASIPGVTFNPIHAIQQGSSSTVTSIAGVNSFNVSIAIFLHFVDRSRQKLTFWENKWARDFGTFLLKDMVDHMNTIFLGICGCNLDDFTELGEQTSKIWISQVLMDLPLSITVSLPTSKRPISFGSTLYFFSRELTTVKLQANSFLLIIQTTNGNPYLK